MLPSSNWGKGLWPSAWYFSSPYNFDGKAIYKITMQNEYNWSSGDTTINIICHEYSHFLGARDFYDYDGSSNGLGSWSLMAYNWLGNPYSPQLLDPWHRYYMGWVNPVTVTDFGIYTVNYAEGTSNSNTVYKVWIRYPNEYFLIENRQKTGWDANLPGSGLLIYHIDESVTTKNDKEWYPGHTSSGHYFCALEQADGNWDLERKINRGDNGDPWPGSKNKTNFNTSTVPNTFGYNGQDNIISFSNITNNGSTASVNIAVSPDEPSPLVTLLYPNGGETLTAGSPYTVQWTISGDLSKTQRISVDYSTDGGTTWAYAFTVSSSFSTSMSYNWTVPNVSSETCKLKIALRRTDGTWSVDYSDSVFTIINDAGDTPGEAVELLTNGTIRNDSFSSEGDVDWYKFTAQEGKTYTIDTLNLGSKCNTVIELYAPDGTTLIDWNDYFDIGSRIDFEVPAGKGGTYYIKVRNYNSNVFGDGTNYDIRVYPALKIMFYPEFVQVSTPTNVTVTVTQDGTPLSGASVYNSYTGETLTTNSSGQVTFNVNSSYSTSILIDVTFGNYKYCYDYLYVLDSKQALIEVKPKDKHGYYLTHFYLEGFRDLSTAEYPWCIEWSDYRNSLKGPVPSGNNLAVVIKDSNYTRDGSSYYMLKATTTTPLNKTNVPFDASSETYELSVNGLLNGNNLSYYRLYLINESKNYIEQYDLWLSDSSGNKKVYVLPGNYTALLVDDNSDGSSDVALIKEHIPVASNTSSTVSYNTSNVGTLNRHCYDGSGNEIRLCLEGIAKNISFYTYSTGESLLLSPSSYQWTYASCNIYIYPDRWYYHFIPSETSNILAGSTQTINFGGHLTETITTNKTGYSQGETVNIKVRIDDAYGHPLDYMYHYNYSSSSSSSQVSEINKDMPFNSHIITEQTKESNNLSFAPGLAIDENAVANSYSEYPRVHLVVKDPTNKTVVDTSNYSFWYLREYGYNYVLPTDAPSGTYTISTSLSTGLYQGTLTGNSSFIVGLPTVTLTKPNGGETLTAGSPYTVQWTISGDLSKTQRISVDYSTDGGTTWAYAFTVSSSFSTSMSYNWTVPNVSSETCKLKIALRRTDGTWSVDYSDSVFTIAPAP